MSLRGNNAPKMRIVNQLSSAMGIRRCAEKMQLRCNPVDRHIGMDHSVMINSVKNGKVTVM